VAVADPKFLKEEGEFNVYQPRRHLSQMHTLTCICSCLYGERRLLGERKKSEPIGGGAAPSPPLNPPLVGITALCFRNTFS